MRATVLKIFFSPSLYSGVMMGVGGVALAGANLILAKILNADAFGSVVLFQALASIAMGLAPLGVDSLIVRGEIGVNRRLLSGIVIATSAFTVLFANADFVFENLKAGVDDAVMFGLACLGGATARLFTVSEQSKEKFWLAQVISQTPSLCFLVFSIPLAFLESPSVQMGITAFVLGQLVGAGLGFAIFTKNSPDQPRETVRGFWLRAVSFLGLLGSVLLLSQLERLVIARYLGLETLANFGVAATLILSPYRLLAAGIGFTLMPRLARNPSSAVRRELFRQELIVAAVLSTLGGVILFFVAPLLISTLYQDKYNVPPILLISLIIAGLIRTAYGIVSAGIGGVGDTKMLGKFNLYGWLATGLAGAAAVLLSPLGVAWVVVGVSFGWLLRIYWGLTLFRKGGARG